MIPDTTSESQRTAQIAYEERFAAHVDRLEKNLDPCEDCYGKASLIQSRENEWQAKCTKCGKATDFYKLPSTASEEWNC